jgi:predicted ABC-type ATPase
MEHPNVVILAGPNGAGKSTVATELLSGALDIRHFVNADTIARGLSGFHSDDMAIKAGKVMLQHLHELAEQRINFAFETTLASRTFAPWIAGLKQAGYRFHLFFIWVPAADVSIERVKARVRAGGHDVPEDTIRRRYRRGLHNFFHLYQPLANSWKMIDNSEPVRRKVIAESDSIMETVHEPELWHRLKQEYGYEAS